MMNEKLPELIYPDLSYQLVGVLFDVHTELGSRYQEKYYQRAIASTLQEKGISFQQQVPVRLTMSGNPIGRYFADFVIDGKIVLEIKAVPRLVLGDHRQVDAYLKALNCKLGVLANFRSPSLKFKRIVNASFKESIREN